MLKIHQKPFIQNITEPWMEDKGLQLFIKREDIIHPYVSGNKWRKLNYNLIEARKLGYTSLLTFGGAYSNHIYATAAAAREASFKSFGIIRGEELADKTLNHTLQFAHEQGMKLHFVTREDYRNKASREFIEGLRAKFGAFYMLPEGGTNHLAIKGTREIMDDSTKEFDVVSSSVGTGGTLAGIITGAESNQKVLGFSALKGDFLKKDVRELIKDYSKPAGWDINIDYHFGGYAKATEELRSFMKVFEENHNLLLDPVYTAKMMYGIHDMIRKGRFQAGKKILAIHTGGLQGRKPNFFYKLD